MGKSVIIVSSCRNRSQDLCNVLPSWLYMPVDKIIICDYGSSIPVSSDIASFGISDQRITIIRDGTPKKWVLSWAYNKILLEIEPDTIIVKIDCDDEATPKLISWLSHASELMSENDVLHGNWINQHRYGYHYPSSGFFIANSNLIQKIGGYNPHILSYGWDDIDLYARMRDVGARMIDAPPCLLFSKEHGSELRYGNQVKSWRLVDISLGQVPFREFSNLFSKAISSITKGKILSSETYSSFSSGLSLVGASLLEEGFNFEEMFVLLSNELKSRGQNLSADAFSQFSASSIYADAIMHVLKEYSFANK